MVITAELMPNKNAPLPVASCKPPHYSNENTELLSGKEKSQDNRQLLELVKRHTNADLLESVNRQNWLFSGTPEGARKRDRFILYIILKWFRHLLWNLTDQFVVRNSSRISRKLSGRIKISLKLQRQKNRPKKRK